VKTRKFARLVVEAHHRVLGELSELGAQSCAFRNEPRNGVVRHRQESTGEAGDRFFEDHLWIPERPAVRVVFAWSRKVRLAVSIPVGPIGYRAGRGVGRKPCGPLDLGRFRFTNCLFFPDPMILRASDLDC
jgi:hypothetical protein